MSQPAAAPQKVWTVRELLAFSKGWFEEREVDSPRQTAEILLAHVLECPRIKLYVDIGEMIKAAGWGIWEYEGTLASHLG